MAAVDRRAEFYAGNRGPRTFHIETDGCIVNITVGLRADDGREVTRVDVLPDDETRGGDAEGRCWRQADGDARVIRDPDPQLSLLD